MTDSTPEPLGVGKLTGESLSLVFGNLGILLPIAFIPSVLGIVTGYLVNGPVSLNPAAAFLDPLAVAQAQQQTSPMTMIVATIFGVILWGFSAAALTRAVYDIKMSGSASIGNALGTGLKYVVPVILVVLVLYIVGVLASIALVLPGLYVMAMWFVIIPAVVVDGAGFGALGRSSSLTKGYRWPMVGYGVLFILLYVVVFVVMGGLQFLFADMGTVGLILAAVASVMTYAFLYCIGSAMAALAYARLTEIKEGMSINQIADVFS
ncbi:MAG: hypothetical protein AAGB15_10520 [Pseudomonadota bacterium]